MAAPPMEDGVSHEAGAGVRQRKEDSSGVRQLVGSLRGWFEVKKWIRVFALGGAIALVAAACSDDGGGNGGGGGSKSVRMVTSSTGNAYVGQFHAVELFGDKFGLSSDNTLNEFEDEGTAAQVLVSGQADLMSGGMTQVIQLIGQGQDIKAFCPLQVDSTEQLAGLTDAITSLDQITDPNIRVAVDSPGGLVNFIMNLVFREKGMGITVSDLQNVTVLGDGSQRLAALAAGDVDVGSVDLFELPDLIKQVGQENVTVLSVTAADADFLANILFAKTEWLDQNTDLAGRWCAATLYSNRVLASDFDQYKAAVDTYIEGGVDETITQTNWDFARQYSVWPYNTDVMNEDAIQTIIDVGFASGLVEASAQDLTFADVVDTRPMEIAMKLLGGTVSSEDVLAGNIPEPQA
jgi:ABC-type nitrate/sulfonate/bicarbonate transport system substrate-binding protein